MGITVPDVMEHVDDAFDGIIDINREIHKLDISDKAKEAMGKNIQNIGTQILVLHSRLSKEIK